MVFTRGRTGFPHSDAVDYTLLVSSIVSCFAVLAMFFMYFRYRALRLHPSSLFIWRGAADLGCCAVIIASLLYRRFASPQTTDVSHCRALSFFNEVFSVAAEGFFLCLALDLREGITSPFTNYRVMMQYCQAAVVLVSLVFGMLLLLGNDEDQPLYGEDNYLSVCWIKRFRKHSSTTSPYFWVMFALPLAAMYSVALWAFATSRTRLLHGLRSTFQNRMTAYANSLWFIMTYVLYWSLIGVLYSVAYFVNDIDPPVAVNCLLALMVGGRGVVTLFVWMYIQDVKEAVVQDASERGGISSVEDLRPKLNLAMRTEIITYASKGIQLSARKAAQSPGHLDVTSGAWRYNVVWLPRDEEVRLTGCLLRLVLPLRDTNSPRDPSVRVAHVHYDLFPDKDSSAILAQAPLPVSAPIPVHPPVLPEFGAIGTLTRSRAEEVAFSGAHAPVRLLSPLPNHARASNSWKSYPAGILSSAAVGSASSVASGVDLAAVPASPTPSPQTLNAATSDPSSPVPLGSLTEAVPLPVSFDEAVTLQASPERSPSRVGSSTRKSSTASEQSYLSFASLRATSKLGEEEVVDLGAPRHLVEDHPEFLALGDFQLHDPVDAVYPMGPLAASATKRATVPSWLRRCWGRIRCGWRRCVRRTPHVTVDPWGSAEYVSLLVRRPKPRRRAFCLRNVMGWLRKGCKGKAVASAPVKAFEFQEYEPHVFRMIRHLVGVSDDEYASAAFDEVKEKCNLGRSGAYLYYSKNNRFILKTMDEGECWVLLDMLHDYYEYLEQQPHSLLTRFFGCYSLHMFGSTTYFVVMENVFHAAHALHERYDLKGSWVNRHRERIEKGQYVRCRYCSFKFEYSDSYRATQYCPARMNQPHEPNTVMKDNDLTYKLRLGPSASRRLHEVLMADSTFLCRHAVMDYSLLLGVHRNKYNLVDKRVSEAEFASLMGGSAPWLSRSSSQIPPSPTRDVSESPSQAENTPTNARFVLQRSNTSTAIMSPLGPTGKRSSLASSFPFSKSQVSPHLAPCASPILEDDRSVRSVFQAYHGGVRPSAVDGPGVYYLGIVDMLQRYTWKKRAERWIKSLFKPISGISSCSPVEYAERFQRRVAGQIIEEFDARFQGQLGGSSTPPHAPQLRRHSSVRK